MGLYEILKLEGIVPGASQTKPATYPQNKFIEAIKKHHFMDQVTIIPQFYCNKGTVLKEKRMCLDNNGFDYMKLAVDNKFMVYMMMIDHGDR
jgi:hypothetical protein